MNTKFFFALVEVLAATWLANDSLAQTTNQSTLPRNPRTLLMTPEKRGELAKAHGWPSTPEELQAFHAKLQEQKQRDLEISQSNWLAVVEGRQPRLVLSPEQAEKLRRVGEAETQLRREYFQSKQAFEVALAQARTQEDARVLIKLHIQRHQEMNAKIRELYKKHEP